MARNHAVSALALMCLGLASASGAQVPVLAPGARVRITGPCAPEPLSGTTRCTVVVGQLLTWTHDTAVVQQHAGPARTVLRRDIAGMEVATGRRKHRGIGAAIGMVGLPVLAAVTTSCPDDNDLSSAGCNLGKAGAIIGGVFSGAILGYVIGGFITTDEWTSVPHSVLTASVVALGASRVAFTIRVRF